eukprot:7360684-Prymnesium_polylepis.1
MCIRDRQRRARAQCATQRLHLGAPSAGRRGGARAHEARDEHVLAGGARAAFEHAHLGVDVVALEGLLVRARLERHVILAGD